MENLTLAFSVERVRHSVTQGEAEVYCNGQLVARFGDKIELVKEGKQFYPPFCGGWASIMSDRDFIYSALWHPYDDIYGVSQPLREMVNEGKARRDKKVLDR